MSNLKFLLILISLGLPMLSAASGTNNKPNVVLIMADDMGYECLSANGSISYETPNLDALASKGILFQKCISQPLCTPSRVKIMTGKYNYRNYDFFGNLNTSQYTFGNMFRDAGYETCIAGKWQLNGTYNKAEIADWNDKTKPNKFGFDEYCLWQLSKSSKEGERYADPLIEKNGEIIDFAEDIYGPDIFSSYVMDFMERKHDKPFMVYYPMVLVHDPFVPTPDSKDWADQNMRYHKDKAYFKDMVEYADKIVGKIISKIDELGITDNTIVIFTGDNGTHPSIVSKMKNGSIQGGKGNTIYAGVHVPLIVRWPEKMKNGETYNELIEFSDFFATFASLLNRTDLETDGKSFLPLLKGENQKDRKFACVNYNPRWGEKVNKNKNQFVMTKEYKLYKNGKFFHIENDIREKNPIDLSTLTNQEKKIYKQLQTELDKHPLWID